VTPIARFSFIILPSHPKKFQLNIFANFRELKIEMPQFRLSGALGKMINELKPKIKTLDTVLFTVGHAT
jgi:hypothetical protein